MNYVLGAFVGNRIAVAMMGRDIMVFTLADFGLVIIGSLLAYGTLKLVMG